MGLDARIRYTQMVIKKAFATILKQEPLNKVTVKKICEIAEINRATFYRYYEDPFDLLDKIEREFLEELQENLQGYTYSGFKDTFILIMVSIKANGDLYQTLFSENGDKNFPNHIFDTCYQYMALDIGKQFSGLSPSKQKWLYYYLAHGCSGIINQWLESNMEESVDSVADFAETLVQNTLRKL